MFNQCRNGWKADIGLLRPPPGVGAANGWAATRTGREASSLAALALRAVNFQRKPRIAAV
jgi:hypothetical protein